MNSVEQKSFENGIMRLVGLTNYGYMAMIITQAIMFVLPSIVLGYFVSIPLLWYGFTHLLHMEKGQTSIVPDGLATAQAILVGFFIPLASSIIPIQTALNNQLVESLDINRSKISGTKVIIADAKSKNVVPYLTFGLICVLYSAGIYYLLPLGLLTMNLTLVLYIFFGILMGMIFGLVLIAFNFQSSIELFFTYLLFFWERKSMRLLIKKNLTLHREKNKLTAIIYSLTLGTIIFIVVALNL